METSTSVEKSNESSSKRKSQYKSKSKTDSSKEKRRVRFLEASKRKRDSLVDEKRGLLNDEFIDNDEWMDWQEIKKRQVKDRIYINPHCKNQLMLSEWLLDFPSDLETNWTAVLCPEGRRTLVIAKKGCTRAYHKNGFLLAKFKSLLPNGAPSNRTKNSDIVILDCIWNEPTKRLFALDVLHWKNQTLLNCDAQFRLYWLKSKLIDLRQCLPEKSREEGVCDVFVPPTCLLSTLSSTLAASDPKEVDGILFYHNGAPYISGPTPLVGWLKPFMLPDRLDVQVPPKYMELRPDDYTTLEQWVQKFSHSHLRTIIKKKRHMKMETECTTIPEVEMSETTTAVTDKPQNN